MNITDLTLGHETHVSLNNSADEFVVFPKMARLTRECIITEKIDGTNAQIFINDHGQLLVGSRNRWITPKDDNHGFARWALAHRDELLTLGPGRHYGEWWGRGIQRGYGLVNGEKRFSLFNTVRWCLHGETPKVVTASGKLQESLPACCSLVPVLYQGVFISDACNEALEVLRAHGSQASPGFMKPEGIVCFHVAANIGFKKTMEGDELPKTLSGV